MSNDEISDRAKRALADLPRRKALQRLESDGATSAAAVQRRVRALAEERKIPPADFSKLMHKRISVDAIGVFCEKHKISYDWLLCGDLKGLQRMTFAQREIPVDRSPRRLSEKLLSLLPDQQQMVVDEIDRLLSKRLPEEPEAS
jgi:hypothetical protein